MESEILKILNLLPKGIGEDLALSAQAIGIGGTAMNKAVAYLMDNGYADFMDNKIVVTPKGKKEIDEYRKKEMADDVKTRALTVQASSDVVWESKKIMVHPAMSFVNDTAYVVQYLPIKTEDAQEIKPVLITSKRQMMRLDQLPPEFQFEAPPISLDARWSMASINHFINENLALPTFKEVFEDIKAHFKYYMDLGDESAYAFSAIWAIGTYFHQLFYAYPYIWVNAAKRSGKTKYITVHSLIDFNAKAFVIPSGSSIFRLIQSGRATLCMDEIEKLAKNDESDVRAILLSGYKKGMKVPRAEETILPVGKTTMRTRVINEFDVYSPKMMANIAGMEGVLEDRCIPMRLIRSGDMNIRNRMVDERAPKWGKTRDMLYLLMMAGWKELEANYKMFSAIFSDDLPPNPEIEALVNVVKEKVSSRHLELWLPMLSIAYTIGIDVFGQIVEYAVKSTEAKEQEEYEESWENNIIQALIANCQTTDWYQLSELTRDMKNYEGLDKLTSFGLKKALLRLKLTSRTTKEKGKLKAFIDLDILREVGDRFGVDFDEIRKEFEIPESSKFSERDLFLNYCRVLTQQSLSQSFTFEEMAAKMKGVPEEKVEHMIKKAMEEGVLMEPSQGRYRVIM